MKLIIAGNKAGPDRATTTVVEDVSLSLRAGGKASQCRSNMLTLTQPSLKDYRRD
jgi:hypothetical protein